MENENEEAVGGVPGEAPAEEVIIPDTATETPAAPAEDEEKQEVDNG